MYEYTSELWLRTAPTLQTDFLVRAHIPSLLGDVRGMHILDAGCGEGYVSRQLRDLGASVFGFDISSSMVSLAQSYNSIGINYLIADIEHMDKLFARPFDIVILCGVIGSFDSSKLYENIAKAVSCLNTTGKIIIASNHLDSYVKHGKSRWMQFVTNPDKTDLTKSVGLKFFHQSGQCIFDGSYYFHPENIIVSALNHAGVNSTRCYAPFASSSDISHFPHMWGDESRIPYHLIIVGQK